MKRSYDSQAYCPVARTLDVIGDRWTLLVLRDIRLGTTKYSELLESLQGISPNLLSQRLKLLEQEGVLERSFYSDHPPRAEYRLTDKGEALVPILRAMAEWGYRYQLDDEKRKSPELLRRLETIGTPLDAA